MAAAETSHAPAQSGTGARCPEAQADGVPCAVLGIDCEICGCAAQPPHAQQQQQDGLRPHPHAQQPHAAARSETTARRMHA